MRLIKFAPLEIDSTKVRVAWTLDPPSPIYRETVFELDYSEAMDPSTLPLSFWWSMVVLILHSHWNLMRPCRIVLPVTMKPGELEFWNRLLDQERISLEKARGTTDLERNIEIVCEGPVLAEAILPPAVDRWATAFSGGKDSLAQAALLAEITERPLLVNTCDPMPPLIDMEWPFRERTLREIARRRDVELVVVNSNLRRIWPHYEAPHELGYPVSLGEMGDPHLFIANTLAVAASRGIRSIFLAAEAETARLEAHEGKVALYDAALAYGLPLLMAIDGLARYLGMSINSLVIPFNHFQIQHLLRRRYADLGDLQISCFWMKEPTERSCSHCWKCFRTAMTLMAIGDDPATLGLDLGKIFAPNSDYRPSIKSLGASRVLAHIYATMDKDTAKAYFPRRGVMEKLGLREPVAFTEFKKQAPNFASLIGPNVEATHTAFFQYIPEALRDRLMAISTEHWPQIDTTVYVPDEERIHPLVNWLTATLKD